MAMVAALKFDDFALTGNAPRQPQGRHHGLCTRTDKADFIDVAVVIDYEFPQFIAQAGRCAGAGSGKSAILERYVAPLLGDLSLPVSGNTTEAGPWGWGQIALSAAGFQQ